MTVDSVPPIPQFQNKYYEIPRNPSSVFTGREEICDQLKESCLPSSTLDTQRRQKIFVIYGLGGSGKTQLCLKFAEDHREKCVQPAFTCCTDLLSGSGAYSGLT